MCVECLIGKQKKPILFKDTVAVLFDRDSVAGTGRPFPHVKAWGGTAQITTQGHRGTFFRVVFRYLAIAALSLRAAAPGGWRH